ncbi:hypothetical protein PQX77_005112 [Marasmius sp. AFHP31]|nr:hypothetical protein PQX77_005112 [Marasmius sp. AFHP31]
MSVEPSDPEHECRLDIDAINTEFMEVYMKYSRRWRTLVLGSAGPHLTTLCRLGVDDIPQLETVRTSSSTVLFRRHEQGIRLAPAGELVTHARSLRTLHITSEWISVQVLTFPLGWSSLTVLRITSPMWQPLEPGRFELGIFLQTLAEQCKSLIVFSLKNFLSYDSELLQPPSPSSLTLVSWTTIREFIFSARGSVNEIFTESIRNALEQIALPGVESLSIAYCDDIIRDPTNSDSDIPAAPWEKLLLSSQPHIHHLELDFPRSHWGIRALLQSLKPLVTLKSLRIGHERAWDMGYEELLRGLREPFEDGLLCPELEELVLEGCVANDVEILPTLVDRHFLTSRPNLKLIRANFGFQIEYDDAARSALSSIQDKNGFDVSAMQREIVLTRKVELGATVILTFGRFHNSAGHHDRPNSGMPGSGRWY